jgi:hypothetical protein
VRAGACAADPRVDLRRHRSRGLSRAPRTGASRPQRPLPCGSGRKYKHCCPQRDEAIAPEGLWRRGDTSIDRPGDRILGEALPYFGSVGVDEARAEFTLWRRGLRGAGPHRRSGIG